MENIELLRNIVDMLVQREIIPIIIIPPFSKEYNLFVNQDMVRDVKDAMLSLKDVTVVDFNGFDVGIVTEDFADTDHLNGRGAYKLSQFLVEKFGE